MKLPIQKRYFDLIKAGRKNVEFRDAHITFVCEETGETLRREITGVWLVPVAYIPKYTGGVELNKDLFTDEIILRMELEAMK